MLKQEKLFREAMRELRQRVRDDLRIDHMKGDVVWNGKSYGLIFPRKYVLSSSSRSYDDRQISFFFKGFVTLSGGRETALEPFRNVEEAVIEQSSRGRRFLIRDLLDRNYLRMMTNSKFALCPNHVEWPGPQEHAWTYRFAEATLNGALPVVFDEMPLGSKFTRGFHVIDSATALGLDLQTGKGDFDSMREENRKLAHSRFLI